jgi:hypothetical protein
VIVRPVQETPLGAHAGGLGALRCRGLSRRGYGYPHLLRDLVLLLACLLPVPAHAASFRPVAVYVDSGDAPLAAYQVEIIARGAEIVGVEGGDAAAFHAAPYYDPAALKGGRIIIAAFSTGSDLPSGKTRVATLHMRETDAAPAYEIQLIVAASTGGTRISPTVSLDQEQGGTR